MAKRVPLLWLPNDRPVFESDLNLTPREWAKVGFGILVVTVVVCAIAFVCAVLG